MTPLVAPDRTREDRKALTQFVLASLGGAFVIGSLVGTVYGVCVDVMRAWAEGPDLL